tara:strand:- start:112 stop:750 length:639 start_codon:yes stop_codon:yes gene_type:complete
MVLPAIIQKITHARQDRKWKKLVEKGIEKDVFKLSKKDFIKKYENDPLTYDLNSWSFTSLEKYYDDENLVKQRTKKEKKDALKMSKEDYVKKYTKFFYTDFGRILSEKEAKKIIKPGLMKGVWNAATANFEVYNLKEQLKSIKDGSRAKEYGDLWEKYNNPKKVSSKNLTDGLKDWRSLKKDYKNHEISKEQFELYKTGLRRMYDGLDLDED